MKMKHRILVLLILGLMLCFSQQLTAQDTLKKSSLKEKFEAEEEEGPLVFKFEPNYLSEQEKRRAEIAEKIAILDTMDISENKRLRIVRALYANKNTKLLSKVFVAETTFEEEIID